MCITQPPKPPDLDATTWHAIGALEITPGGSRYPRTSCQNHKHHVQNHKLGSPPALLGAFGGWAGRILGRNCSCRARLTLKLRMRSARAALAQINSVCSARICRAGTSRSPLAAGARALFFKPCFSYNRDRHVNPKF